MPPGRVTIRDVAARAGVSTAAVSQALNGKGTLAAATRERIRGIAEEMGYQADALARGMTRSPMGVLGLILRPLDQLSHYNPQGVDFFLRLAGQLSMELLERGVSVMMLRDVTRRPLTPLAYSLDGYLVVNPLGDDPVVTALEERELPYVMLGRDPARPDRTRWVGTDDAGNMAIMLEHLRRCGARQLLLVEGADRNAWNIDSAEAYRGWCARQAADGVTGAVVRLSEDEGILGGRGLGEELARGERGPLPDAVVCMTGRHAAGVQQRLRAGGHPEVMVCAISDSEHSRTAEPPITTLRSSLADEVTAGADMIQRLLAGEPVEPRLIAAELEVRGTGRLRVV
ncbi:LacI family DNA-binding transcriptional regulator [Nesterenkonia suensis]